MSGRPSSAAFMFPVTDDQKRVDQERDTEARTWYHETLPGGMPRDWLLHVPDSELVTRAALLSAWQLLHYLPGCDCKVPS